MEMPAERPGRTGRDRARDALGLVVAWGLWASLTIAMFVYTRQNSRNIPYWDEFAMVSVMTGSEPVDLRWAWSQHNEHRPMISRLIMAGLLRWVAADFRVVRYANAALLSAMAAAMLILARRIRGSARIADAVLPLSILSIAQAECLMNGFAMNLILTSLIAVALIVATGLSRGGSARTMATGLGLSLVLLPLSGGSGLTMLPPLALWVLGYAGWGWWSGRRPSMPSRAIGLALLAASVAVVLLYLRGYERPSHHPLPPSMGAVVSSILMYLSLAIYPHLSSYAWPAGAVVIALVTATLGLLAVVSYRRPEERPRALAMMAIILSMLCVAVAVGYSRSGLGPAAILASRYVTLTIPMLCALYISWLLYARGTARSAVHLGLVASMCLAFPSGLQFGRDYGAHVRGVELRVERALRNHASTEVVMSKAHPALFADPGSIADSFRKLKAARVGAFVAFEEGRIAAGTEAAAPIRR